MAWRMIMKQKLRHMFIALAFLSCSAVPVSAYAIALSFDTEILLLLAGPVSEAVQETVLLVRRGDNFVSKDSLGIGCIAGAAAGFMVAVAPTLGFVESTVVGVPVGVSYIAGTMLLSCAMTIISAGAGMGTVWGLKAWRSWRDAPIPAPDIIHPPVDLKGIMTEESTKEHSDKGNKNSNKSGNKNSKKNNSTNAAKTNTAIKAINTTAVQTKPSDATKSVE